MILGLSVITRRRAITEVFVFYDFFDFLGVRLRTLFKGVLLSGSGHPHACCPIV
jgi:hypothetical protein